MPKKAHSTDRKPEALAPVFFIKTVDELYEGEKAFIAKQGALSDEAVIAHLGYTGKN